MNLAVFDVDGTLTNTEGVHTPGIVRVMNELFAIEIDDVPWQDFEHVTDSFVAPCLYERHRGCEISAEELARYRAALEASLVEIQSREPHRFRPIAGAGGALQALEGEPGWAIAIASGGWGPMARRKLRWADLPTDHLPQAYAEDGISRAEIVACAIERAMDVAGVNTFDRIVSIGDGAWDLKTAAEMEIAFLGLETRDAPGYLGRMGAAVTLSDYSDLDRFFHGLEAAGVPAPLPR